MPVPRRKKSKSRRDSRRSQYKVGTVTVAKCSKCGEVVRPHCVCQECGYYKGREIRRVDVQQ